MKDQLYEVFPANMRESYDEDLRPADVARLYGLLIRASEGMATAAELLNIPNVEVRREGIERFSAEKWLADLGANLVNQDGDNFLYRKDSHTFLYLKDNSTPQCGAKLFANGILANGVLIYPGKLQDTARKNLKKDFRAEVASVENAGNPLILEEGMRWQQLTIPPGDETEAHCALTLTAHVGPCRPALPPLPPFRSWWFPAVQLRWLEVYRELTLGAQASTK